MSGKWQVRPCQECVDIGIAGRWQIFTPKGLDCGCSDGQDWAMTLAHQFAIQYGG